MVNLLFAEGLGELCDPQACHVPAPLSQVSDVRDGPIIHTKPVLRAPKGPFAGSGAARGGVQGLPAAFTLRPDSPGESGVERAAYAVKHVRAELPAGSWQLTLATDDCSISPFGFVSDKPNSNRIGAHRRLPTFN